MSAAPTEVDMELKELESRLERLRSLYEQYFIGIERLEPTIPRKDVDRRIQALGRARLRNTAKRFKLQTLVQRYNTYQQYWMRTCREIENGTYARHLVRAKNRFGGVAGVGKRGRRGKAADEELQKAAELRVNATKAAEDDLAALLKEDLSQAIDKVLSPAASASVSPARAPRLPENEDPVTQRRPPKVAAAIEAGTVPVVPAKVQSEINPVVAPSSRQQPPINVAKQRLQGALAANPARRRSAPKKALGAESPPAEPSVQAAAAAPTSPAQSSQPSAVAKERQRKVPEKKPAASPPPRAMSWAALQAVVPAAVGSAAKPPTKPPALPAKYRAGAQAAEAKRAVVAKPAATRKPAVDVAAVDVAAAAKATAQKAAATQVVAAKAAVLAEKIAASKAAAVKSAAAKQVAIAKADAAKQAAARQTAAAKPAAVARTSSLSGNRMDELHRSLVSERGRLQQRGKVSRDALEKSLRATEAKLQSKYKGQKVGFQVVVKDGKAIVKPVIG